MGVSKIYQCYNSIGLTLRLHLWQRLGALDLFFSSFPAILQVISNSCFFRVCSIFFIGIGAHLDRP